MQFNYIIMLVDVLLFQLPVTFSRVSVLVWTGVNWHSGGLHGVRETNKHISCMHAWIEQQRIIVDLFISWILNKLKMKTFILFSIIAMVAMVSAAPTVNDGGLKTALEIAVKQGVNLYWADNYVRANALAGLCMSLLLQFSGSWWRCGEDSQQSLLSISFAMLQHRLTMRTRMNWKWYKWTWNCDCSYV